MSIVMNMSNYAIERESNEAEYGKGVMYADWNPAVVLNPQPPFAPIGTSMPADLATADAETFLQRMHASTN